MNALPMKRIDAPRPQPPRRQSDRDETAARARRTWRFRARAARGAVDLRARRDGYADRAEAGAVIDQRPNLEATPNRRLAANAVAMTVVLLGVLMLFAVVLRTRLAERQAQIDRLQAQVDNEHARFDVLRQQRAELRSPGRLASEASDRGMFIALDSQFAPVDPWLYARILAATGSIDGDGGTLVVTEALDQVRQVNAADDGGVSE